MKRIVTALTLATASAFAASGELKTQARQILADHQDSVVWLSVIVKQEISAEGEAASKIPPGAFGGGKDQKVESTGTIVDGSGLIVASLGSLGGGEMLDGQEVDTRLGAVKLHVKSDIKEVKVITADGSEIPADVVMKDPDLDLAFFKIRTDSPEAKGVTFKAVDLKNSSKVDVLDDVVVLGRLGADMQRQPMAYTSEVLGLVKKPREFLSIQTLSQGIPVFTPDGKTVGISIIRKPSSGVKLNPGANQMHPAVLPAKDVLKDAEQALQAKPEAKPDDAKPAEAKPAEAKPGDEKK